MDKFIVLAVAVVMNAIVASVIDEKLGITPALKNVPRIKRIAHEVVILIQGGILTAIWLD